MGGSDRGAKIGVVSLQRDERIVRIRNPRSSEGACRYLPGAFPKREGGGREERLKGGGTYICV